MKLKICLLSCMFLLLSNCSRYFNWAQSTFTGGVKRQICMPTQAFTCSSAIYDQFRTVGLFDVLWLNRAARSEFVKLRTHRQQLTLEQQQALMCAQEHELDKKITFYVLMPALDIESLPVEAHSPAPWSVSLQVDNRSFQPVTIKHIELEPEFAYMFDCYYLSESFIRFRRVYEVTFDRLDDNQQSIITTAHKCVKITISSIEYCTSCQWQISPGVAVC
jgi:hypothetical protein